MQAMISGVPSEPAPVMGAQKRWLIVGLLGSLLLHATLCAIFYRTRFQPAEPMVAPKQPPPMFHVKNIDLQPKPLDKTSADQTKAAAKPIPDNTAVQLPDEKKSFEKLLQEVHASAAMPDDTRDVLPDKPKVEQTNLNSVINEIEKTTAQTLSKNPNARREQSLLNDSAISGRPQPALNGTEIATSTSIKRPNSFTSALPGDSAGPRTGRAPGFSDLDQLLSQAGPLGSATAPISMPTDQLFPFGEDTIQPETASDLQKLATLIKRNPKATFTVEGFTDSIGSPEYNLELSQRRAESVKRYLVESMSVDPAQIQARGLGSSKFVVKPRPVSGGTDPELQAEIARQQPNRRVVIVVDTGGR